MRLPRACGTHGPYLYLVGSLIMLVSLILLVRKVASDVVRED